MRTISMLLCLALVVVGFCMIINQSDAGIVPMMIGSLSFLIIVQPTKKIRGYNRRHLMNR